MLQVLSIHVYDMFFNRMNTLFNSSFSYHFLGSATA